MHRSGPKVAIIGAGAVGSSFAYALMISGLSREIALIDSNQKRSLGEAMDLNHGVSFLQPVRVYSGDFSDCKDADIVVITAGAKQLPQQTRLDLVKDNFVVFKEIIPKIASFSKDAVIIVVTNPVDILTFLTLKLSGLPADKVIGSGTVLDSSRLRFSISEHCKVDSRNVHAYIIGEHGDSEFAVWSQANIAGISLAQYCLACNHGCNYQEELAKIFEAVKLSAYKIIEAKGATNYAVGLSLVRIVEAILRDENSVLPISTLAQGFCGIENVCLSAPCVINRSGVAKRLELKLNRQEEEQFKKSAATLKDIIKNIGI